MQPLIQQKWFLEQEGNQTSKNLLLELEVVDKTLPRRTAESYYVKPLVGYLLLLVLRLVPRTPTESTW